MGPTLYAYNTLGALTQVQTPTKIINYHQNTLNQRVAKEVDGVITEKYLWKDLTTLLAIYDNNDSLVQRFEYTGNRIPISMTQNNQKYYLHYDQVGTLRAVTDVNHNIIKEITYDTFGNILNDSNQNFKVPFGFAGGLHDRDTGLVHFGYREYDTYTGKWTAKDPIDFNGGDTNLYGYVLEDPVNFIDPEGLISKTLTGLTVWFAIYNWDWFQAGVAAYNAAEIAIACQEMEAQFYFSLQNTQNSCMSDSERLNFTAKLATSFTEMKAFCSKYVVGTGTGLGTGK